MNAGRVSGFFFTLILTALALSAGCGQQIPVQVALPVEVTTIPVVARDVPIALQYLGQTESSRAAEIRARVDGYLQAKYFIEGAVVRQGAPLFLIEPRSLQLAVESTEAALKDKENLAQNAKATLERLRSLITENAVSKKDFDDASAVERSSAAALAAGRAELARTQLNLSYTHISAPFTGLVGRALVAEGSYINPAANGLLTTVTQYDPMWVNFSISENEWVRFDQEKTKGTLLFPANLDFDVELILSDGTTLGRRGKINFGSPSVDTQTGTYAIRASFPNPDLALRPGQFVRVRLLGLVRPAAILVPQRAVMQGQTGKFVYVVNKENKAEIQPVEVGDWYGNDWFVSSGLKGGEQIVVGNVVKVQPGALLKPTAEPAAVVPASQVSANK